MIKTYLFELLKVNSRVIIPDFGAFLVKEKPGGKMEISFNDFLKFNDGLLANKIIKAENITKTEAIKKIKEFIKEIEDKIKTGERFEIEKVGEFHKDDFGRIKFDHQKEDKVKETKPLVEKPGEKTEEKVEQVTEVKAEAKAKTEAKDEDEAKEKDDKKKDELKEAKKEEEKKKPIVADILKDSEMITAKPLKHKSSSTLIWVSGIVVLIAALITWAVIDYDRIKSWFDGSEKEIVETLVEEVTHDETAVEETPDEEVVPVETDTEEKQTIEEEPEVVAEKIQETAPEPAYEGPKYYVIAGSFKLENNAINHHKRLLNEGYNSENLGLVKGFHIVSFDGYKNLEDAVKMLKMVRADQPDAWVMKH